MDVVNRLPKIGWVPRYQNIQIWLGQLGYDQSRTILGACGIFQRETILSFHCGNIYIEASWTSWLHRTVLRVLVFTQHSHAQSLVTCRLWIFLVWDFLLCSSGKWVVLRAMTLIHTTRPSHPPIRTNFPTFSCSGVSLKASKSGVLASAIKPLSTSLFNFSIASLSWQRGTLRGSQENPLGDRRSVSLQACIYDGNPGTERLAMMAVQISFSRFPWLVWNSPS